MVQARSRCHWRWVQLDFLTAKVGCTGHRRSPFVGGGRGPTSNSNQSLGARAQSSRVLAFLRSWPLVRIA